MVGNLPVVFEQICAKAWVVFRVMLIKEVDARDQSFHLATMGSVRSGDGNLRVGS